MGQRFHVFIQSSKNKTNEKAQNNGKKFFNDLKFLNRHVAFGKKNNNLIIFCFL